MEMKNYIFLTDEGYTYSPGNEDSIPDVQNLQVIGFSDGANSEDAFNRLLQENSWLKRSSFNNIFSFPMDKNYTKLKRLHCIHGK